MRCGLGKRYKRAPNGDGHSRHASADKGGWHSLQASADYMCERRLADKRARDGCYRDSFGGALYGLLLPVSRRSMSRSKRQWSLSHV